MLMGVEGTAVKTLLGLLILIQMPFVAIAFFAAGTDGKGSSQLAIWAFVIPIGLCQAYAIYRIGFGSPWGTRADYVTAVISCAPLIYLVVMLILQAHKSR
jgi:hypothetical protein